MSATEGVLPTMCAPDATVEPAVLLTGAQILRWRAARADGGLADQISPAYLVPALVNAALLATALAHVVRRHVPLRTRIEIGPDDEPQATLRDVPERFPITVHDLRALSDAERRTFCRMAAKRERDTPLDLGRDWPLRATLLSLADDQHTLLLTLSHVTGDGWSCGVLVRELQARYRDLLKDPATPSAPVATAWAQYVEECAQDEAAGRPARDLPWWCAHLAGAVPCLLSAPLEAGRVGCDLTADTLDFELPAATGDRLRQLASSLYTTVYTVTLAAFAAVLVEPSGANEAVTTVPYAGREELEHESLIGLFASRLALRFPLHRESPFTSTIDGVQESLLDALDHCTTPISLIEQSLVAHGSPPIGQVTVQVYPRSLCDAPAPEPDSLSFHLLGFRTAAFRRALGLFMVEPDSGPVTGALTYQRAALSAEQATELLLRFGALLDVALDSPERPLGALLAEAAVCATEPALRTVLRVTEP